MELRQLAQSQQSSQAIETKNIQGYKVWEVETGSQPAKVANALLFKHPYLRKESNAN
jgi:hypothetical protein